MPEYTLSELLENDGHLLAVEVLRSMPYPEYLRTNHWKAVRNRVMQQAGWKCQLCPGGAVDAHHMTYENRGDEGPGDVIALCRVCHSRWHETWIHKSHAEGERI